MPKENQTSKTSYTTPLLNKKCIPIICMYDKDFKQKADEYEEIYLFLEENQHLKHTDEGKSKKAKKLKLKTALESTIQSYKKNPTSWINQNVKDCSECDEKSKAS